MLCLKKILGMANGETNITQVGSVTVPVSDQERALDFYVNKLGFEKRLDVPYGDGDRWLAVAPRGSATSISIVPPREGDSVGVETRVMFLTADADAEHEGLLARGVDVDEQVLRMGGPVPPMFSFRDLDGNKFSIVEQPSGTLTA